MIDNYNNDDIFLLFHRQKIRELGLLYINARNVTYSWKLFREQIPIYFLDATYHFALCINKCVEGMK
jgi:hypothetical protein